MADNPKTKSAAEQVRELATADRTAVDAQRKPESDAQKALSDPQSLSDLESKGKGIVNTGVVSDGEVVSNVAHGTPRHDVPVAHSVIAPQNLHQPPDLREFTPDGRVRDQKLK